jgi:hypothetical protein
MARVERPGRACSLEVHVRAAVLGRLSEPLAVHEIEALLPTDGEALRVCTEPKS